MLRGVQVDGEADVNVMTILAMMYIGFNIKISSFITLKITNEEIYKPQDMIFNVCINGLGIFYEIWFTFDVKKKDVSYPKIHHKITHTKL